MNTSGSDIGSHFLGTSALKNFESIGSLVTVFVRGAFILSGLVILVFFIMAGIGMIQGAGEGNPQKMEQAKATATSALIGFIVVFASYWIVKLIGQILNLQTPLI